MSTQSLTIPLGKYFVHEPQHREFNTYVKPPLLVAYGTMANTLFWSGLVMPYGVGSAIYVAYLHVMCICLGFAMAWGGSMATLMLISRKKKVPFRSLEFIAGSLNLSVLAASAVLLFAAYMTRL